MNQLCLVLETGERKTAEIDIVSINERAGEILFGECKWRDKADARKILAELKEKAKLVQWKNQTRKEHYSIFAKSFKERLHNNGTSYVDDCSADCADYHS